MLLYLTPGIRERTRKGERKGEREGEKGGPRDWSQVGMIELRNDPEKERHWMLARYLAVGTALPESLLRLILFGRLSISSFWSS